jgi:putative ATP-dependent endonuclease of OLD family
MVEGDAENLLIPAIAELMDKHLHKHGVSIVNVGSTAYKRYVSIFKRKDGKTFDMPISVVSDLDERALEYYDDNSKDRKTPYYWLKETVRPHLEAVTTDVDYDTMASMFGSLTAFEKEVRANKTMDFAPIGETISRLKAVLTDDKKTKLNEAMLSSIREEGKPDCSYQRHGLWNMR